MEDSPIFYNNSNKPLSKAKIIEKKADYKKSILEKLSKYNLKQVPGIEKSANYKRPDIPPYGKFLMKAWKRTTNASPSRLVTVQPRECSYRGRSFDVESY